MLFWRSKLFVRSFDARIIFFKASLFIGNLISTVEYQSLGRGPSTNLTAEVLLSIEVIEDPEAKTTS